MIQTSAPTRFDLAGAPTDVAPYKTEEGGYVVNASLGIRVSVSVSTLDTPDIVVMSRDLGVEERFSSIEEIEHGGALQLIKTAIAHVHPEQGIYVSTTTEAPRGAGLGASASLAVALLSALRQLKGESPSLEQLVQDALHVENVMLGNINGGQDQYAAALGGFHALEFGPGDTDVKPLYLDPEFLRSLEEHSLLCYSGDSRVSGHILDQVMAHYTSGDRQTVSSLRNMKRIAQETTQALIDGSLDDLDSLIQAAGEMQRNLHAAVTPPAVQRLLEVGRVHGVHAAKMAGAGGGGCVYFFGPPERRQELERAFRSHGVQMLPMQFSSAGLLTTASNP